MRLLDENIFDKDIFTQLVSTIHIKSPEDITFELKDGTLIKGKI